MKHDEKRAAQQVAAEPKQETKPSPFFTRRLAGKDLRVRTDVKAGQDKMEMARKLG